MQSKLAGLLGLASIVALSSLSFAETSAPPKASDVYDRLAKATLDVPKTATLPKSIPATEKVDGFYVDIPQQYRGGGNQGPTYAMVYASAEAMNARNSGQELSNEAPSCFMNAYPNYAQEINWSQSFGAAASVQNYKQQNYPGAPNYGSVNLVRADKIVKQDKDKLEYSVKFAYVDAETTGVRLHSEQKLQFTLLSELPGQVKVWGAKSDDQATFLIRREKLDKERNFHGPLMVNVNGMHVISASEMCPVIFSMKTGKGVSASAIVQLEALLGIVDTTNEAEAQNGLVSRLPGNGDKGNGPREAKVRPMKIGISNSWMSQDEKPIISVSHGWAGKERTQPI